VAPFQVRRRTPRLEAPFVTQMPNNESNQPPVGSTGTLSGWSKLILIAQCRRAAAAAGWLGAKNGPADKTRTEQLRSAALISDEGRALCWRVSRQLPAAGAKVAQLTTRPARATRFVERWTPEKNHRLHVPTTFRDERKCVCKSNV